MEAAVLALGAVLLGAGLTLMAWIVKTLLTTVTIQQGTAERLDDIEKRGDDRFRRLEGVVFEAAWKQRQ